MSKIKRLIKLNQMAGPLFRELAVGLSSELENGCLLHTGHPDTLRMKDRLPNELELVGAPKYNRKSSLTRVFSWLRYLLSTTWLILFSKKTDGFLISSNPPFLGIWFWLLNYINKRPYIVLIYDIHPDVLVMMGVVSNKSLIVKAWNWINKKVYRDAKVVVTLGKHMANRLSRQNNINKAKLYVIPPWVDTDVIKPIAYDDNPLSRVFNPDGKHIVLYSGNMGISHDIDSMLEAAKDLQKCDDILFLFIGGGEKYQDVIDFQTRHQLSNMAVYPYQPESDLPHTMSLSSISIVALDRGAEELMVPSKLFHYMAAGSAVIGICQGENELKDIIKDSECGVCVEPGNVDELVVAIEQIIDYSEQSSSYKENARIVAVRKYSKSVGVSQFLKVINEVGML
jgi:glycosyltransferase involved in cell wall biosynthesis